MTGILPVLNNPLGYQVSATPDRVRIVVLRGGKRTR